MKRSMLIAAAVLVAACGRERADEFRRGFPKANEVNLEVPARAGQALSGASQRQDALEGDRASFYVFTRVVTATVNSGTAAILGLVKAITDNPPTSITGNVATWGPHTDPLSPNTFKFTVMKTKANDYSYTLEAKGKNDPNTAYVVILSGTHVVATDANGQPMEKFGSGTFLIDWNEAQKLPEHDANVGSAEFVYSRPAPLSQVEIDVVFSKVKDHETGQLVDALYKYVATPGSGGSFDFGMVKNLDSDPAKSAVESATIHSRWLESGAGRSDVRAKGGDIPGVATLNECWDSDFNSRYLAASFAPNAGWGSQSACAFPNADYSNLPL
ncbi:MAG: hypothetical protein HYZ28_03570 [Myxococcales bacterium]|nr:hypothetical protein [Myxococcales bacterium]